VADVLDEGHRPLGQVAGHRLRRQLLVGDPRVAGAVRLEHRLEQLGERTRPGDVLERLHALLVLHALGLHLGDGLALGLVALGRQHLPRIVEGRLDDRQDVEGVRRALAVEQLERGDGERRQRLVEREVDLQVDGQPDGAAVGVRRVEPLDDAGAQQRPVHVDRLPHELQLTGTRLVVVEQEPAGVGEDVPAPLHEVEQHRVRDLERGRERLGVGGDEPLEGRLAPRDEALGRLLALDPLELLRVVTGLGDAPRVLDVVLGRLHDDVPAVSKPGRLRARRSGGTREP
jgi:hypothetical protein